MPQPKFIGRRLEGRTALVTGAGSQGSGFGTGKAISMLFAAEGARVCLVDRDFDRAEQTRKAIADAGGESFVCTGDVTVSSDCERMVSETVSRCGGLDILVNNVGLGIGTGRLEQMDDALWHQVHAVNLTSAMLMTKYAIPHLITCGHGAIVNISSIAGLRASGGPAYSTSKAALIAFTRSVAAMYGREHVRANAIAPGHIYTPLVEQQQIDAKARETRRKVAPLGIEGDAWDVAAAALFLASDDARFITAACLPVDGGVTEISGMMAHSLASS